MTKDAFLTWVAELYDRFYPKPGDEDPYQGYFEALGHGDGQRCEGCDTLDRLTDHAIWTLTEQWQRQQAHMQEITEQWQRQQAHMHEIERILRDLGAVRVEGEIFQAEMEGLRRALERLQDGGPDDV